MCLLPSRKYICPGETTRVPDQLTQSGVRLEVGLIHYLLFAERWGQNAPVSRMQLGIRWRGQNPKTLLAPAQTSAKPSCPAQVKVVSPPPEEPIVGHDKKYPFWQRAYSQSQRAQCPMSKRPSIVISSSDMAYSSNTFAE
jgi:hypothetical protein